MLRHFANSSGVTMRRTIGWRTRAATADHTSVKPVSLRQSATPIAMIALLALAGCGSSAKSAVKSVANASTTTVKTTTTAKPKPTTPPTTLAATTVPVTSAPATVAPVTAVPAQNCPNGTYVNSSGNTVCSPYQSPSGPPAGATAKCNDGTYSFSQHHSGTCSHHGGVAVFYN
jgi:Protein of unknown function (DUF3761)